jgi:hypothetical protein
MKRNTGLSGRFQAAGLLSAVTCILLTASPASATTIATFNNEALFLAALQPNYYLEDFNSLPSGAQQIDPNDPNGLILIPENFSSGGFHYSAASPDDSIFITTTADQALSTNTEDFTIVFTFLSDNINAVGGNFFRTDFNGDAISGAITVAYNDGTTQTFLDPDRTDFSGFIFDSNIASLTVSTGPIIINSVTDPPSGNFATVDNFTVGATPEPQSVLLLLGGLAAGALRLRRRNAQPKA